MDNGLRGRYLAQLEAWNEARQFASELVEAFSQDALSDVLSRWSNAANFPSLSAIKSLMADVMFLDGIDTINRVAQAVMDWDGWYGDDASTRPRRSGNPAVAA